MKSKPVMTFQPGSKSAEFDPAQTVLEVALSTGIGLSHSCGGMASCGTCRIEVIRGVERLEPRNEVEAEMASAFGWRSDERLACQTLAVDGLVVMVPDLDMGED